MNRLSIALLALLICAPLALAEDDRPVEQPKTERITIDLNEIPLVMAFQRIAALAELNVIVDASITSDPATRDVDITAKAVDVRARDLLRQLALTNGLHYEEQESGVILIRPAPRRTQPETTVVVQIHAVSDLCKDVQAAQHLAAELRRVVPTATIKPQGHTALVVRATLKDQDQIADALVKMRQIAAAKARSKDPHTVKLRFFDVKDLVGKFHKLPARMKRLFPGIQAAEQKKGILIVRATNAQLERVTVDLNNLRRTLHAGRRGGLPPPPPPAGPPMPKWKPTEQLRTPTEAEWERAARGPLTLEQRIESLRGEVRALRQEVRELRALLEQGR